MNLYMQQFQTYIEKHPPRFGHEDIHTIAELLYNCYTELNPIDTAEIRGGFREIDQIIRNLSVQDNDRVFTVVCQLCTQHERLAFLAGMRVGAQLLLELQT